VVVLVDPGGERTMLSHRVPFARAATHVALPAADWTVVSGYLLAEPDAASLATVLATRPGERVVLGCAVATGAARAWETAVRRCQPGLLVLNAAEAATLLGTDGDAAALARGVAARLGSRVVVTVPDGAVAAEADGAPGARSSRRADEPASDTTGAGDALAAGIVATLASGGTLRDALAAGVALGDLVARVPGAQGRVAGERAATLPS
jgi:sugar/nucleoside kinase (ribokinase family)